MNSDDDKRDVLPPHSIEAEQATLGAMMLSGIEQASVFAEIRATVDADSFSQPDHGVIYGVLCAMFDAGTAMTHITLVNEFKGRGLLDQIGGIGYIATLLNSTVGVEFGLHYARIVAEKAKLRQIIRLAEETRRRCYAPAGEGAAESIAAGLAAGLADIQEQATGSGTRHISEIMAEVWEQMNGGGTPRIETGITPLDAATGGLGIGEMTIIAARPSMGKSLLAKQICRQIAATRTPVGIISIEESAPKIGRNYLSSVAHVQNFRVRKGQFSRTEWDQVGAAVGTLSAMPIYANDRLQRLSAICSEITLMALKHKCRVICVDYLQLIDAEGGTSREQEVSRVSRRLKNLFKQLNVAGLVVAQLNRGNEQGAIRPPRMSDLRDSGQIEQDGDVILLLHRPDYYRRDTGEDTDNTVQIIPAKVRDGSRENDIVLYADLDHQQFTEMPATVHDPFQ